MRIWAISVIMRLVVIIKFRKVNHDDHNCLHALNLDSSLLPVTWVVTLPAQRIEMGVLAAEIARQCGVSTDLIRYESNAALEAAFSTLPTLSTPAEDAAGFRHEGSAAALAHIAES